MTQDRSLRWLDAFDRALKAACLLFGGALLFFMMLFGSFNVLVMRKALNNPVIGAEDLLIVCLVTLCAISIPFGGRVGAHIEIEVLERFYSRWFDLASRLVLRLVGCCLMGLMTWQLMEAGHNAERFGETTQQLLIPYGPFYYILAICVALYALVLASDVVQLLLRGEIRHIRLGDDDLGGFE